MVDCLTDCNAICCRKNEGLKLVFGLSRTEARRLRESGAKLTRTKATGGGYTMEDDCSMLDGIKCRWHKTPLQPKCCVDNKAGGEICSSIRNFVLLGKRFSEVE